MLQGITYTCLQGAIDREVSHIAYHSKNTGPGTMFICIDGVDYDGHTFAKEAVEKGSAVVLCSKPLSFSEEITVILVDDCRSVMAEVAAVFYQNPARHLKLIGVTGTKGKTTVSWLLRDVFREAGVSCGLIGTIENDLGKRKISSSQTTPESLDLQRMLREMADSGCQAAVIEVSSQALKQKRTHGLVFDLVVFTGIGEDHIGPREHGSLAEYIYWKGQIFHQCKRAVVNGDSPYLRTLLAETTWPEKSLQTYSLEQSADLCVKEYEFIRLPRKLGVEFQTKGRYNIKLVIGAPGRFSMYNGLAVTLAAKMENLPEDALKRALMKAEIPGRQELFSLDYTRLVMVDYAHNGEALEALLLALKDYHPTRLTCIFGCGGERAISRRCKMGKAAAKYADFSIVTADNPRKESLDSIIRDIIKEMGSHDCNYCVINDRQDAIEYGIRHCQMGEIVVVAGKGHETKQLLAEGAVHFDDREVVLASIEKVKHEQDYNRRDQKSNRWNSAFRK